MLDRMPAGEPARDPGAMHEPTTRSPDNELYDRGADLVVAAAAIRRSAASLEAARAVPALLGCIEAALEELLWAAAELEQTTGEAAGDQGARCRDPRAIRVGERMHSGFANLQQALSDAHGAAAAARPLAARALARTPARPR
jgi:hypothetical protein